ncbi:MAG: sulfur oxidation c-type cytochrome SoxA [Alphaproteobacteria bacterium]|nr:sulfur oxidation c-type cytochrome SoxA [Alphaproteobacteria bacterium]
MTRRGVLAAALAAALATAAAAQGDGRLSGFAFMGPDTQAMQTDETANPGMLWVAEGEALWSQPAGPSGRSCASCHGEASRALPGVAARYPAIDEATGEAVTLDGRINLCRQRHQQAPALALEGRDMLSLSAFVGHRSHGMPIDPPDDPRMTQVRARGEAPYRSRQGQLNFSCANCHDDNAGGRLGAAPIPQAHPTGYPIYRLEWQGVGSLQRRLRNCLTGVRAEPFVYGAPDLTALESFLASRAKGMTVETPAVRP